MRELWKDIPNYEGIYQASNFGRIKSLKRSIKHWTGSISVIKERFLKQNFDGYGYLQLTLNKKGVQKTFKVHKLIAMSFFNHKPSGVSGLVIDHINNEKTNNRVDNLQITTHRVNVSKDVKNKTSKYTGVSWRKDAQKWYAQIIINKKHKYLGLFDVEYNAHLAYQYELNLIKKQ